MLRVLKETVWLTYWCTLCSSSTFQTSNTNWSLQHKISFKWAGVLLVYVAIKMCL